MEIWSQAERWLQESLKEAQGQIDELETQLTDVNKQFLNTQESLNPNGVMAGSTLSVTVNQLADPTESITPPVRLQLVCEGQKQSHDISPTYDGTYSINKKFDFDIERGEDPLEIFLISKSKPIYVYRVYF